MEHLQDIAVVSEDVLYAEAEIQRYQIEDATFAVRIFGKCGPAVVLIHGYPVHGYTWRKLLPSLSKQFTCYVIDLPGLGDSDWSRTTNFSFTAQANRLVLLFAALRLDTYSIIAHDTGATLARLVALRRPQHVLKLVLINTEIPDHRPPWIPLYQLLAKLPLSEIAFRAILKSQLFLRSSMGLGQFYSDSSLLLIQSNIAPYIDPLTKFPKKTQGMLNYLRGIEWRVVDELSTRHKDIKSDVLFLWGVNDKTFPISVAEKMLNQFSCKYRMVRIDQASLMPHEEKPKDVLQHLLPFLLAPSEAHSENQRLNAIREGI